MMNRNLLPMKEHNLGFFTRGQQRDTIVCEASTLFGGIPMNFQRIYADAVDVGIAVKSNKTGVVQRFALVREERYDGDIRQWEFVNIDASAVIKRVIIFND